MGGSIHINTCAAIRPARRLTQTHDMWLVGDLSAPLRISNERVICADAAAAAPVRCDARCPTHCQLPALPRRRNWRKVAEERQRHPHVYDPRRALGALPQPIHGTRDLSATNMPLCTRPRMRWTVWHDRAHRPHPRPCHSGSDLEAARHSYRAHLRPSPLCSCRNRSRS